MHRALPADLRPNPRGLVRQAAHHGPVEQVVLPAPQAQPAAQTGEAAGQVLLRRLPVEISTPARCMGRRWGRGWPVATARPAPSASRLLPAPPSPNTTVGAPSGASGSSRYRTPARGPGLRRTTGAPSRSRSAATRHTVSTRSAHPSIGWRRSSFLISCSRLEMEARAIVPKWIGSRAGSAYTRISATSPSRRSCTLDSTTRTPGHSKTKSSPSRRTDAPPPASGWGAAWPKSASATSTRSPTPALLLRDGRVVRHEPRVGLGIEQQPQAHPLRLQAQRRTRERRQVRVRVAGVPGLRRQRVGPGADRVEARPHPFGPPAEAPRDRVAAARTVGPNAKRSRPGWPAPLRILPAHPAPVAAAQGRLPE